VIWQNPWAWAGLAAIALPILIHLLGRGHARIQRFPTLRFLEASRLLPTRRTRVHDLLLLLVRIGIIATAVAAFAQPLWLTANRTRTLDAALARAIIVDTSASMGSAIAVARQDATRLASEAQNSTIIETANPSRTIAGAVAWLGRQPARGELVLVSDFQLGAIDSADIAAIPPAIGVRLARIDVTPTSAPLEEVARVGNGEIVARIAPAADRTDVTWTPRDRGTSRAGDSITVFAGATERTRAAAAMAAARTEGVRLPLDSARAHDIAIVEPQFEQRAEWLRRALAPKRPWMIDVIARLRADPALQQASANATMLGADSAKGVAAARDANGRPVVVGVQDSAGGRERLLLVSSADAGNLASAMLIASVQRALSRAAPLSELEPLTLPANVLASWQREPAANTSTRSTANANAGASDGRWLWIIVLVLLALETWMRRAQRDSVAQLAEQQRAA
jgi:hypothetical protein